MSLSPEQLERRRDGITGTDIGAICGVSPWKSPLQVWLEKTGQAPPFEGNLRTKWGSILEAPIRDDYAEGRNVRVEVPGTLIHPKHDWWMGSPDGIVYPWGSAEPSNGLEIKVHGRDTIISGALVYGELGTDQIPLHELFQDVWYMGVTELDRWDHIVFLDGAPVEYTIERDEELIGMLQEKAEQFLTDHVRKGVPPEPDGGKADHNWLAGRWKKNSDELVELRMNDPMLEKICQLREVRAAVSDFSARESKLEQEIKVAIGDRAGFTWREVGDKKPQKVTWKRSKPSPKIDWPAVSAHLRDIASIFVSAKGGEVAAAIAELSSEPMTGALVGATKIVELISTTFAALREIAEGVERTYTTEVPGNRMFLVPRSWNKDTAATTQEG